MEYIALPLSQNYISHWGTWEAIREIIQNAMDQGEYSVDISYEMGSISIESKGGVMEKGSLLLGHTSKADDPDKRGKFGEGYKLALLVLSRQNIGVTIKNGSQRWSPSMRPHPQIDEDCLTIGITEDAYSDEFETVRFSIHGLSREELAIVDDRVLNKDYCDIVADDGESYAFYEQPPAVYVGGLFVCNLEPIDKKSYELSYNFAPDIVNLDRDRQTVSEFTIAYEATSLLNRAGEYDLLVEMASNERPDVSGYVNIGSSGGYYSSSTPDVSKEIAEGSIKRFYDKYGEDAYPINKDWASGKIGVITSRAIAAGLKPITVSKAFFQMFDEKYLKTLVAVELVPAKDLLMDFLVKNKKHMRSKAVQGINLIIKELQERNI